MPNAYRRTRKPYIERWRYQLRSDVMERAYHLVIQANTVTEKRFATL